MKLILETERRKLRFEIEKVVESILLYEALIVNMKRPTKVHYSLIL
jgi:hypothetical protein